MFESRSFKPSEEFPVLHSVILAIVCFSTAISITGLFAYVGFMVLDFKATESENAVGYYAGYIGSSMMLGRLLTSVTWGQLADTIGRKPVICAGCASIAVCSLLFGFSTNIYMAIIARFTLGLLNPIWGIAKTLTSELYHKKYQPTAVGLTTGCWNIGLILGPSIGGLLSRPTNTFPELLGNSAFLQKYPYILPNLVTSVLATIGLVLVVLYFPETLHKSEILEDELNIEGDEKKTLLENDTKKEDRNIRPTITSTAEAASLTELMGTKNIIPALCAYFILSMVQIMFDELIPLWAMSTSSKGGMSVNQVFIGQILGTVGLFLIVFTFIGYPFIAKYLGPIRSYFFGQLMAAPFIVLLPLSLYVFHGKHIRFAGLVTLIACVKTSNQLSVASMTLIINAMVPANKRASLNGLSLAVGSLAKFIGPIAVSVTFAYSVDHLNFHLLVFFIIAAMCACSAFIPLKRTEVDSQEK
jgi:MFS family permease